MEHSKYAPHNVAAAAIVKEKAALTNAPTAATTTESPITQEPQEPQQQEPTSIPQPPIPTPPPPQAQDIPTAIPEAISSPPTPPPPGTSSNGILDDINYTDGEFSQTRPPDDLFTDDFTPIAEPIVEDLTPAYPAPQQPPQNERTNSHPRGGKRGRGGASAPRPQQPHANAPTTPDTKDSDRSATGGPSKPRLTEAELTARMDSIKLKNASLEAAHARASADEARFMEREKEAAARAAAEKKTQAEMMRERERNKAWKLERGGGREWDEGKEEQSAGRGGGFRRGAHGGIGGSRWGGGEEVMPEGSWGDVDDAEFRGRGGRGRGRGGRGRGRGDERARGRGGRGRGGASNAHSSQSVQAVPDSSEFPALAPTSKDKNATAEQKTTGAAAEPNSQDRGTADAKPKPAPKTKESWAEQMDDPVGGAS